MLCWYSIRCLYSNPAGEDGILHQISSKLFLRRMFLISMEVFVRINEVAGLGCYLKFLRNKLPELSIHTYLFEQRHLAISPEKI